MRQIRAGNDCGGVDEVEAIEVGSEGRQRAYKLVAQQFDVAVV